MRWFISIRYFLSHKRQSLVCIAGVTISVTMFLSMTAMMEAWSSCIACAVVDAKGSVQAAVTRKRRGGGARVAVGIFLQPNSQRWL